MHSPFVSTKWLADHLSDPNVVIVDASWYMPAAGRDPEGEYLVSHIPGAVFFGIDEIADKATNLPHMLPSPAEFAAAVGALGISEDMTIVVYDETGLFSAPRVWWTFRTMGARDVRILEGGGARWRAEKRMMQSGPVERQPRLFDARYNPDAVADFDTTRTAMNSMSVQIADARPMERFRGAMAEPRPGLKSGRIPGSVNVPFTMLTDEGTLKSPGALKEIFTQAGVNLGKPLVTTCGSGITAATLALALETAGAKSVAVYDGSWAEWGGRKDADIAADPRPASD
jgi:thiosulfate/3-mercaptopyruvate sulfurtransferase